MTDPYAWIASLPKARQKAVRQHLKEIEHGRRDGFLGPFYAANANAPIVKFIESCTLRRRGYKAGLGMNQAKRKAR